MYACKQLIMREVFLWALNTGWRTIRVGGRLDSCFALRPRHSPQGLHDAGSRVQQVSRSGRRREWKAGHRSADALMDKAVERSEEVFLQRVRLPASSSASARNRPLGRGSQEIGLPILRENVDHLPGKGARVVAGWNSWRWSIFAGCTCLGRRAWSPLLSSVLP